MADWRQVWRRQRLASAERWLTEVEESAEPETLIRAEYDNLLRALEMALESDETFELANRLVQALFPLAFGYGDSQRWRVYLEQALASSALAAWPSKRGRLLEQLADIDHENGQLEQAIANYEGAMACFQADAATGSYARVMSKLGAACLLQGEPEKALSLGRKAANLAEAAADEDALADVQLSRSHVYFRLSEWTLALEAAAAAAAIYERLDGRQFRAKALLNVTASLAQLGRWDEIELISDELMDLLKKLGDVRAQMAHVINLGVVAFHQERYKQAEQLWHKALSLQSQSQEPSYLGGICNNLGKVYTRLGDWELALMMFDRATETYQSVGDRYQLANTFDNLADLYEVQGELEQCRQALARALAALGEEDETPASRRLRGQVYERLAGLEEPS